MSTQRSGRRNEAMSEPSSIEIVVDICPACGATGNMLNAEAELAKLRTERDAAKIASNLSHEAVRLATKQNDRLLILCGKLREALIVANSWTYNATPREVLEPIRQTIQEANEVLGEVRG